TAGWKESRTSMGKLFAGMGRAYASRSGMRWLGRESRIHTVALPRATCMRSRGTRPSAEDALLALGIYTSHIYPRGSALVKTAKLFKNGDSQAVRLPREFRFAGSEVLIKRTGNAVVLLPKTKSWETLISSLDQFSDDFMDERDQPGMQKRESL